MPERTRLEYAFIVLQNLFIFKMEFGTAHKDICLFPIFIIAIIISHQHHHDIGNFDSRREGRAETGSVWGRNSKEERRVDGKCYVMGRFAILTLKSNLVAAMKYRSIRKLMWNECTFCNNKSLLGRPVADLRMRGKVNIRNISIQVMKFSQRRLLTLWFLGKFISETRLLEWIRLVED